MSNVQVVRGRGPRPANDKNSMLNRLSEYAPDLGSLPQNVGGTERMISMAAAGALAAVSMTSRSAMMGLLGGAAAVGLAMRGLTGHCSVYQAAGINTAQERECDMEHDECHTADDMVTEASEESFPASDPPAYSPTSNLGDAAP